jgi:hypothetical protein
VFFWIHHFYSLQNHVAAGCKKLRSAWAAGHRTAEKCLPRWGKGKGGAIYKGLKFQRERTGWRIRNFGPVMENYDLRPADQLRSDHNLFINHCLKYSTWGRKARGFFGSWELGAGEEWAFAFSEVVWEDNARFAIRNSP